MARGHWTATQNSFPLGLPSRRAGRKWEGLGGGRHEIRCRVSGCSGARPSALSAAVASSPSHAQPWICLSTEAAPVNVRGHVAAFTHAAAIPALAWQQVRCCHQVWKTYVPGATHDRLVLLPSEGLRLRLALARAGLQPAQVVRPPAAFVLGGPGQPRFGAGWHGIRDPVGPAAAGIRRVDQCLEVAAVH